MDSIRTLGRSVLSVVRRMGLMGLFLIKTLAYSLTPPFKIHHFLKQLNFIGTQSVLVILLTGLFTGMVMGIQGFRLLTRVGSEGLLGPSVALPLLKEMGPVLTALMVTGRAGSAIAAEIGIMRISEQIDAIELMGLNPFRYLVVPNFLAAIIALPILTTIFNTIGIWGGYLVGVKILGVEGGVYFGAMPTFIDMHDIMEGIYKAISFGMIISWISCYKGYYTGTWGYGASGVSNATTQAVVLSAVLVLIWDYVMTSILF